MGNGCMKRTGEGLDHEKLSSSIRPYNVENQNQDRSRQEQGLDWNKLIETNNTFLYEDMQKGLNEEPKRFLLNNIALSVQFLKNFERDKSESQKSKEALKSDLDNRLKEVKKNCLLPGSIFDKVNEYVSFRTWHSEGVDSKPRRVLHPLITEQFILCYTNIEIDSQATGSMHIDGEDSMQYTSLNDRTYRGALEGTDAESTYQGYVKVRIHEPKEGINPPEDLEASSKLEIQEEKKPVLPILPSLPPIKDSFAILEDVAEGDEDEDSLDDDDMDDFKSKVMLGIDNYVNPPNRRHFAPSTRQLQRDFVVKPPPALNQMDSINRQGRRDSGVFHESQFKLIAKQMEVKEKLKKKSIDESDVISEIAFDTEFNNLKLPDNQDGIYVEARKKPLETTESDKTETRYSRGSIIPSTCFEKREKDDDEEDDTAARDEEDMANDDSDDKEQLLYLSSKGMMKYFQQQYPSICDRIEKTQFKTGSNCSVLPPDVFCSEIKEVGSDCTKIIHSKFTPSIECSEFVNQMKVGWDFRKQPVMKDKRTNTDYRWPDLSQKQAVSTLGFNIVPVGFTYPRLDRDGGENKDSSIQWQIRFVKAETYLAKSLHYPKVKVYFLLLVLYKKYLEKLEGITEEHLKHIFYSKIEKNPTNWTEENAGEKLLNLLETLWNALKAKKIENYFINKCNMLDSVSNHKIHAAQEQVYRIIEKPVYYLLAALHDIQYEKNFYPEFDSLTSELYEMLTKDKEDVFGALFNNSHNSDFMGEVKLNNINEDSVMDESLSKDKHQIPSKDKDKYQRKMTKIRLQEENEKQKEDAERRIIEEEQNKYSTDHWLDTDWTIDKNETRWKNIMTFFLKHFLDMAEKSNQFRNHGQAFMYYQQANNLYRKLEEEGFAGDGNEYYKYKLRLQGLGNNLTDLNKRDYWDIGFSHPKLIHSASFRSEQRVSIPLPSPPSEESSPIPGTKRPDETSLADALEIIQNTLKANRKENRTKEDEPSEETSTKHQVNVTVHDTVDTYKNKYSDYKDEQYRDVRSQEVANKNITNQDVKNKDDATKNNVNKDDATKNNVNKDDATVLNEKDNSLEDNVNKDDATTNTENKTDENSAEDDFIIFHL